MATVFLPHAKAANPNPSRGAKPGGDVHGVENPGQFGQGGGGAVAKQKPAVPKVKPSPVNREPAIKKLYSGKDPKTGKQVFFIGIEQGGKLIGRVGGTYDNIDDAAKSQKPKTQLHENIPLAPEPPQSTHIKDRIANFQAKDKRHEQIAKLYKDVGELVIKRSDAKTAQEDARLALSKFDKANELTSKPEERQKLLNAYSAAMDKAEAADIELRKRQESAKAEAAKLLAAKNPVRAAVRVPSGKMSAGNLIAAQTGAEWVGNVLEQASVPHMNNISPIVAELDKDAVSLSGKPKRSYCDVINGHIALSAKSGTKTIWEESEQKYKGVPIMVSREVSDPTTMIHELGHHLEAKSQVIHQECLDFLEHRCGGEKPFEMSEKHPNSGYEQGELGREDEFKKAFGSGPEAGYVGKDYGSRATEILSMGLQKLYTDPAHFAYADPEYFSFTLGVLSGGLR